jgi:hypothetical protein
MSCTPIDAFTSLNFATAHVVRSNLGGAGGRCVDTTYSDGRSVYWYELCDERQPSVNVPETPSGLGNMHVLIRGLGSTPAGEPISLLVRNESEYRPWNSRHNGVKRSREGSNAGSFVAINLLGPRSASQSPAAMLWHSDFTLVQLSYSFVAGTNSVPITIGRTFLTFYDFDTGEPTFQQSRVQVEGFQPGPQAAAVELPSPTEIETHVDWATFLSSMLSYPPAASTRVPPSSSANASSAGTWSLWSSAIYSGSTYGVGNDNPTDVYALTAQQTLRAVMVMLEATSIFQVCLPCSRCTHSSLA